jgi:mRNA interferase MazF
MPPTIAFRFGDVVLVPFPFTDQTGSKKRPAIVVSAEGYQASRRDLVIMAVTSRLRREIGFGEFAIAEWQRAGLVISRLGRLAPDDLKSLRKSLRAILG